MTFNAEVSFTHIIAAFALLGLLVSYRQLRLAQQANRARLIIDLSNWFTTNEKERKFFYRLDYSGRSDAFRFVPEEFPGSDDEHHLDSLLYKLSHVGALVRDGAIRLRDLGWLHSIADIVLRNRQVHAYLDWIKTPGQIPGHRSFANAVYLYTQLHKADPDDKSLTALNRYLAG